MATQAHHYHFDKWAEYLTLTLAENISHCHQGHSPVARVRITLMNHLYWPVNFKVMLSNQLVANRNRPTNADASHPIDYLYHYPGKIPRTPNEKDPVAHTFIKQALAQQSSFYEDAWSLSEPGDIPSLLRNLALRSTGRLLGNQLLRKNMILSEDFSCQFHEQGNFLSFSYEALKHALTQQVTLYLGDKKIREIAAQLYFKHAENRSWFMGLTE